MDDLKAAVRRFYDRAWNAGDVSIIDELFADDYIDHDAVTQTGGLTGRESAKAFVEIFRRAVPDMHCEIQDQIAEGDKVVSRWVATGTHAGELLGVPASGRSFRVDGISIDRFDDQGRFIEGWGTWDGVAMLRQIGGLPG